MLELSKLIVDSKAAWIDYPQLEGFRVEVAAVSRKELTALRERCITKEYNRKSRTMVENLDDKAFVREFTDLTVKNWEGLTLEYLQSLLLIEIGDQDPAQEYEYSKEHANELVTLSTEFDTWLNEVVFDLDNFRS
jgi:hypothetical protein